MNRINDIDQYDPFLSVIEPRNRVLIFAAFMVLLPGLILISFSSYPLFHSLAELFGIVIALGIFVIAWIARPFISNSYLLLVGIAYLFVGGIDLVHALAYKGMGFFRGEEANLSAQLWIAARSLQGITLLVAPYFIERKLRHRAVFAAYAVVTALLLYFILALHVFPDCYQEGTGLTPFKKISEYVICAVLIAAGVAILRKRGAFDRKVLQYVLFSLAATIASELAFTFYQGVYDHANLTGHVFKIIAFSFMFAAIIKIGFRDPYKLIYRRLRQSQEELLRANEELEQRVEERTRELTQSNELIQKENAERAKSDAALHLACAYNRSLIEASLDPLVTIGPDGRITDVNAATEEVTGRSRTELIGKDFSDYFTEPDKARTGYLRVFQAGWVRDYPLEIKRRDGHITPVLYNATVYRDESGKVTGVFAAARDITERIKAEEEARLNAARQKSLLDLYQKMASAPVPDIISFVVDKCVNLTGSALGFVGLVSDEDEYMVAHLWSEKAMQECAIGKPLHFPIKAAGIWAEPIRQRRAMIINDYTAPDPLKKGYPEGHLDLTRFMGIPVVDKDRVVAVAGIANKQTDYTESDQTKVALLLEGMWDLIKRKKAEEALRLSEARLNEAQRIAHIGHWELDLVRNALLWSDEIYRIFEIAPERFGASYGSFLNTIHPDDRAAVDAAYTGSLKSRAPYAIDHRLLFPDGRVKYVHEQCETYYDQDDKPLRSLGTVQEVTSRKRMEEELRRAGAYNRSLIEASLDPLVTIGPDGRITDVNAATEAVTGKTRQEIIGTDFSEYFTDPERARAGYQQAFREGSVRDYPLELRHKSGTMISVLYNATVYRDETGKIIGVFAAARDITERMRAEKAQQENEKRFKRLVESTTDYIYTVKVVNGFPVSTVHGPGCVTVTGYRPEEYEQDPYLWNQMVYAEDRQAVLEQAAKINSGATVMPLEHRIHHKNGSLRWLKNTPVPRYDAKGALISYDGLISDITDRKKLEDQLRQAQKMEAIGQLAGGIAHDFNNILSAIIGYGHILHMKMKEDDPLRMNVQHLLESADRAAHLTHSLLAFSRKQIINPIDVNLNEVIQRTEKFLRRIIGEDIDLKTVFRKDRITVHADSSQLEQVFMNLATNARDAMEHGGRLTIEVDVFQLDESYIRAHGYGKQGWYALIMVSDTGKGMDEETVQKVFEPFFTTKEQGKGTGLGLAMIYGIVKQHNGYVNVYSEPGKGSTFKIYLPLVASPDRGLAAPAPPPEQEVPGGTETILLAEDDEALRKLTTTVLSEFGYRVIESIDGEDALRKFRQNQGSVKLLLLDMVMPRKNGREVYEEIRKVRDDIKVIFMSGYTADRIFTEGYLARGTELLLKPVSPRDLLNKVRDVLDRREMTVV